MDSSFGVSESETEPELAALDARAPGSAPLVRTGLRGLRLTEGTDAILQASIVGNPKPRVISPSHDDNLICRVRSSGSRTGRPLPSGARA